MHADFEIARAVRVAEAVSVRATCPHPFSVDRQVSAAGRREPNRSTHPRLVWGPTRWRWWCAGAAACWISCVVEWLAHGSTGCRCCHLRAGLHQCSHSGLPSRCARRGTRGRGAWGDGCWCVARGALVRGTRCVRVTEQHTTTMTMLRTKWSTSVLAFEKTSSLWQASCPVWCCLTTWWGRRT